MATAENRGRSQRPDHIGSEILDRQPPRSLEAERAVLGSIILLPEVADDVALLLRPDDFYDVANQILYRHMLQIHDSGRQVDHTLLLESLRSSSELEQVGGPAVILETARAVPTAAHAQYYAKIVHDKATVRKLIASSTEILRDAYDESTDSRHLLSRAEERIFAILDQKNGGAVSTISEVLQQSLLRIDARMQQNADIGGLSTGFTDFDGMTGGLHGSELIILAARPSMGKTALAMNIAEHAALEEQAGTLFVSLEMSSIELGDRLLCSVARVNGNRLRNGTITGEDRRSLVEKAALLSQAPLFVDDSPSRSMTEIAAAARRLKRKQGLGLIVIDYLQLIDPDNPSDPRQEQVAKIARRLKGLARELEVPILCLAQLNRQAEASRDNRPKLSHLRESGAIEQDADVVMFIHREEYYQTNEEDRARVAGEAEIIIAKQRNGPVGEVPLTWLRDYTRFENAAPQAHAEFEAYNTGMAEF